MGTLSDKHREHLYTSGLSDETIAMMGCESVTADQIPRILNWPKTWTSGGILFPYPGIKDFYQVRFDEPQEFKEEGREVRRVRYLKPKGSSNHAYILDPVREVLTDPTKTLYITEGEKKAAKLTQEGLLTIGLSGVWSWLTATDAAPGAKKKSDLLPGLRRVAWNGRRLVIIWDSDAVDKPDVLQAGARLRATISQLGAIATFSVLPGEPGEKVGADDFLVKHGIVELIAFLEESRRDAELRNFDISRIVKMMTDPPIYRVSVFNNEVQMSIKDLMSFKAFQVVVTQTCNRVPIMQDARSAWVLYFDELLAMVLEEEDAPEEASTSGLIWQHTIGFLSHEIDEPRFVEGGHGPLRNETNFYLHGSALLQYLRAEMGTAPGPAVWTALRQKGASSTQKWFRNADEKWVKKRVWILPTNVLEEPQELEGGPVEF